MLPPGVETPRGRELQEILNRSGEAFSNWPMLKKEDYNSIGGLIVLYSYIELNLRRIVEAYDHAALLQPPWKGKSRKLRLSEVEMAVQRMLAWREAEMSALKRMEELRSFRNLVAHFAIRRFPDDEAFVFIARSAKDYEKQFGAEPPAHAMLTAVLEAHVLPNVVKEVEGLQNWLATVAVQIETQLSDKGLLPPIESQ